VRQTGEPPVSTLKSTDRKLDGVLAESQTIERMAYCSRNLHISMTNLAQVLTWQQAVSNLDRQPAESGGGRGSADRKTVRE